MQIRSKSALLRHLRSGVTPLSCLVGAWLLLFAGCAKPARPNILLITFDTTRWDHVGWQTGRKGLTPTLDALAARGSWFSHCQTAYPLTLPSHTTILTGLYPFHHGVRNNGTYVVPGEDVTLAERLKASGYATHAVVSAFVLDSQFGLDQGFDSYDDDLTGGPKQKKFMFKETRAAQTTDRALSWMRSSWDSKSPFFMWVHYFDPHADYEAPSDVAALFPNDPYRAEIHYADRELGRLMADLETRGLLNNTLVVFTSDHGDGLGEHGEETHGIFVYDSTTRVPMIVAGPGVPAGQRVDHQVRTADIVPTVLDLLGLTGQDGLDGRSLRPLWEGGHDDRTAYTETLLPRLSFGWSELRALRSDRTEVIQAPRKEVYNRESDPGEAHNLAGSPTAPADSPALFQQLEALSGQDPFTHGQQQQQTLTGEARQKLEALGYVSGAPTAGTGPLPDPKDRIQFWGRFQASQALIREGRFPEALASIEALLQDDPDNLLARYSLASILTQLGQRDRALELYRLLMVRDPTSDKAYLNAASLLRRAGNFAEAEALARKVIAMLPQSPEGYVSLGDVLIEENKLDDAEKWFNKALEIDPHSALAASGVGNCLNRQGRFKESAAVLEAYWQRDQTSYSVAYDLAVVNERLKDDRKALELYKAAIRLEPDNSMAWNNLGSLLNRHNKLPDALKAIRKAVELDGENLEAAFNLGSLLLADNKPGEALPLLDRALQLKADFPQAQARRAQALEALGRKAEALAAWQALTSQSPQAWVRVARLELALGDRSAAGQALERATASGGEKLKAAIARDPALQELLKQGGKPPG